MYLTVRKEEKGAPESPLPWRVADTCSVQQLFESLVKSKVSIPVEGKIKSAVDRQCSHVVRRICAVC